MAGHSKWVQIKRKKEATDAAKSRVFSRYARLIALESKKAGGKTDAPNLKAVIDRAKAANMPKDNIERAITKGALRDAASFEQVAYEAYGPGGAAIIIDVLTDNRNRTIQELKRLLGEHDSELASPGAASWAFIKTSAGGFAAREPLVEIAGNDEAKLAEILSALNEYEDVQIVYTNARDYESAGEDPRL